MPSLTVLQTPLFLLNIKHFFVFLYRPVLWTETLNNNWFPFLPLFKRSMDLFMVNVEWPQIKPNLGLKFTLDDSTFILVCLLSSINNVFWTSCTVWSLTNMDLNSPFFFRCHLHVMDWNDTICLFYHLHVLCKLFWTNPWCIMIQWFIECVDSSNVWILPYFFFS